MTVLACVKWVPTSVTVDGLDGSVTADERSWGASPADQAALELALRVADRTGAAVTVACVGPPPADSLMRDALARGADRAVRFDHDGDALDSARVAAALATAADDVSFAVCGDRSLDRGSAATPAFLAAELGLAQILGVAALQLGPPMVAERRTERGGRDRIALPDRAVVSVDGSLTVDGRPVRPRRAPLPATIANLASIVDVERLPASVPAFEVADRRPFRPRTRVAAGPDPQAPALERIVAITDAVSERTPPRTLVAEPPAAADAIIAQLRAWGHLADE